MLQYISFRSSAAVIVSLFITMGFGHKLINFLRRKQISDEIRDLGLQGQLEKQGTPTMGGLLILASIVIPTLLFANLKNVYILLMLLTTVWLGGLGFVDDYIKVFRKHKKGLGGWLKILGQVSLGIIVVATLYFSDAAVAREPVIDADGNVMKEVVVGADGKHVEHTVMQETKSTRTTIPFFKDHEFDYAWFVWWTTREYEWLSWLVYAAVIILIIVGMSNAANLTDGIDGLATGTSAISGATLGILAYVSGNVIFSDYLNIIYIPNIGELSVFVAAFIGATVGFLWYNSHPAQVFMGDTGSLALGGILAVFAVIIRKEILLPLLCGIFLVENLSVVIQVSWFKWTKQKYGVGRRVFLMTPIHHHFQQKKIPEEKIVTRFWIVGIVLAVVTLATLKIR